MLKTWKLIYKVHAMYEGEEDYEDTVYMYTVTPECAIGKAGVDKESVVSIKELVGECRDPEDLAPADDDEIVEITLGYSGSVFAVVTGRCYIWVNKIDGETKSTDNDFAILVHDNGRGIPGNMNPEVMCYHGFRGSYDGGYSTWAEGSRMVKEIIKVTEDYDGIPHKILVRLSRDLAADED